jgi:pimeloyl-ACP methyl ester carboxylesterase
LEEIKVKKRFLSAVMAMLMILSIMPLQVFANEQSSMDGSPEKRAEWLLSFPAEDNAAIDASGDIVSETGSRVSLATPQMSALSASPLSRARVAPAVTKRYTVLVLDRSGSMYGTPMSAMKQSALVFCDAVLQADGENYVAVVAYDDNASILCNFTADYTTLQSVLSSISDRYATNTNDGLVKADNLLSAVPDEDGVVKNILLLSDGMPNWGSYTSTGRYTYSDYYDYAYANAAYNTATALKDKGYYIYTLGFFHSLYGSELTFARRFMSDLQNAGYYDVVNPGDLEFVFGEIADDIVKDDTNYPIIIVPGVMGSRLFTSDSTFDNSTRVWDPVQSLGGLSGMGNKLKNDTLYVRPPENQKTASVREYGAQDTYQEIVDSLCEEFPDREIYFFSYDWRKDNAESARKLKTFIDSLKAEKVNLVCHSMGGLVASSYYAQNELSHKINKIITAGTPYEGAPKLINSVQNWDILQDGTAWNMSDNFLGIFGRLTKDVKSSFTSVAELAPTKNYISKIPMWQDSWKPFNWGDYELTYAEYVAYCNRIFGKANFDTAQAFHTSVHDSNDDYNVLLQYPNAYFSIGINQPTITAIKFQWLNDEIDQLMYESDLAYNTKGDATVPYLSGSIMEQITKLPPTRYRTFSTDHSGTIGHHYNGPINPDRILKN